MKIHDSRDLDAEDRFTAHIFHRTDVPSVSAIEFDIETYGPNEDVVRVRMIEAMRKAAKILLDAAERANLAPNEMWLEVPVAFEDLSFGQEDHPTESK